MGVITLWVKAHGEIKHGSSDKGGVIVVQTALNAEGASLVIDGDFGSATKDAVEAFQARHNLDVDGEVGPDTGRALDEAFAHRGPSPIQPPTSVKKDGPWLTTMRAITGTKELAGSADSPIIMAWKKDISAAFPEMAAYTANYSHDSVPWCGLTTAYAMAKAGIRPPYNKSDDTESYLYAMAWAEFGVKLTKPIVGCVMVFSRSGGGHVSILEKMDGRYCYIRGGNQSDMVNVTRKSMDTFITARWPYNWPQTSIIGNINNAVSGGSES